MVRKWVFVLLSVILVAVSSGCRLTWKNWNYQGFWEQEYDFAGQEINIEGSNGSITVNVWAEPWVKVTAKWSAKVDAYQFEPEIQEDESRLAISSTKRDRHLSGTSYIVSVPKDAVLKLRSSNGAISVSGDPLESLDIHTSNGPVNVSSAGRGKLTVTTSNGRVQISNWEGEIGCTTSNGSIRAILSRVERGEYSFITSNGEISVAVASDSQFELHASTSNGRVGTALPGEWTSQPSGTHYHGSYNGGGAKLTLSTSNNNLRLLPSD
jgi:DUF4097 and DUF4098 domain-containing protein YvlB